MSLYRPTQYFIVDATLADGSSSFTTISGFSYSIIKLAVLGCPSHCSVFDEGSFSCLAAAAAIEASPIHTRNPGPYSKGET
jgi:hypothetical protein